MLLIALAEAGLALMFFMHLWANDDAKKLAAGLKAALSRIAIAKG